MFDTPTVFVLGAGASWHYGYPTGEDLIPMVIEKAEALASYFDSAGRAGTGKVPEYVLRKHSPGTPMTTPPWHDAKKEAMELAMRLRKVNPTLIDYFLSRNPDLHDIGRLVIALVILECEFEFHNAGGNPNHIRRQQRLKKQGGDGRAVEVAAFQDDWLKFVLHKLTTNCDDSQQLLNNEVSFVTFNYDVSLEKRLFDGLSHMACFTAEHVTQFFEGRVVHAYGGVREKVDDKWSPFQLDVSTSMWTEIKLRLDYAFAASKGIRTIDGPDKVANADALAVAKVMLKDAHRVYILGYSFEHSNNMRIGLSQLQAITSPSHRAIYFTNFNDSTRVSRAAGRLLVNDEEAFFEKRRVSSEAFATNRYYRTSSEMSTKDVYGALANDFEI